MRERIGVLFVCLGNICRSPLAEGVFREIVRREGLDHMIEVDSAGTSAFHTGDAPDPRTAAVAERRGLRLDHAARQVRPEDLRRFQYVVAMDQSNLERLTRLEDQLESGAELHLLRAFDASAGDDVEVPDPYFGGADGFEEVHDMIERAGEGLLRHLRERHGL
jgi:protein-tyrosine phosphatase